jgi:putative toxin-antitoxin system antitoxin component (TIGR02293 family)
MRRKRSERAFVLLYAIWLDKMSQVATGENMVASRNGLRSVRKNVGPISLGKKTNHWSSSLKALEKGLPFSTLEHFQRESGLGTLAIAKILRIPQRTLSRRKAAGRLTGLESERLLRLADLYQKTLDLFEGDADAARNWLGTPNRALGRLPPLALAESEIGARAVEDLIGRLEHGVYS